MNPELDEAAIEAQLDALDGQIRSGDIPQKNPEPAHVVDEADETPDEPEAVVDDEEARAKADGHVPYEEWVKAGKDPRAWRPAAEFNRRGEMLKTGKPDLIDRVEKLTRAQEEQAKLFAEQVRLAREEREAAFIAGKQAAIQQAREEAEAAWQLGDRKAHEEAVRKEREAERAIEQRQAPVQDQRLVEWQAEATWFSEGFDESNKPKTPQVEAFLDYQKAYMLENPKAAVYDSVKFAEAKVKRLMPDAFKPKTPQARTTAPAVDTGQRVARSSAPDPLEKYNPGERKMIKDAAKAFGKTVPEYIKMIEG